MRCGPASTSPRKHRRLPLLDMRSITRPRITAIHHRITARLAMPSRQDPFKARQEVPQEAPYWGRSGAMPGAAQRSAPASALSAAQYVGGRLANGGAATNPGGWVLGT